MRMRAYLMQCLAVRVAGRRWGTTLSHEIFDRIAGLTQVPLAALCDKVKPSMKPMSDKLQFVVIMVKRRLREAGDKLKFVGPETNRLTNSRR